MGGAILFSIPVIHEPEEIVLETNTKENVLKDIQIPIQKEPASEKIVLPSRVLHEVPFTSQAPFGAWGNPRFEDGCEEASILMASLWVSDTKILTQKDAEREILALSALAEKKFGFFEDSSAEDSTKFFREYFDYKNVSVKYDISIDGIKRELADGNIVLVPTNGQKLKNPYYTAPGPDRHYLLARGYDDALGEFIVNDPGTKRGEKYHYKYDILFDAIGDYPTGKHKPIINEQKAMIVVQK